LELPIFRRLIPLAVAIVLVIGCKKTEDTGGTGGESGDPNATYTINIREEQQGDKMLVVKTESFSSTTTGDLKNESEKGKAKYEYTEEILEMPEGADKPTKLTRMYKTAEKSEKGEAMKALSYSGKTVTIEKKGKLYTASVDGKPLQGPETDDLLKDYNKPGSFKPEDILPKKAVKLNETWTVDEAGLKKVAAASGLPLDTAKSSLTGKLTKAYTKNGKQWGTLELKFDMALAAPAGGSGKFDTDMTIDTPIDGSSHELTRKMKAKGTVGFAQGGKSVKTVIEATEEETRTPGK